MELKSFLSVPLTSLDAMKKWNRSLVLLSVLQLALGFEPGYQFLYNYHGRSAIGFNELKLQNAVVEVRGKVIIQSPNEHTLYVKLNKWRLKRNGNWLQSQFFTYQPDSTPEEIEGAEDLLPQLETLSTPFVVTHKKGSFVSLKIGSDEPTWIVNLKKSIAGQLQLDLTGVRSENPRRGIPSESNSAVVTFEDTVTGDCSTMIQMNRIPAYQVPKTDAYHFPAFQRICKDEQVFEIFKTKDFNLCLNNPFFHSVTPPNYVCTLGRGQCGNAMQRTSTYKYIGCGPSFEKINIVNIYGFSDFIAMPFGANTERMNTNSLTSWVLLSKEDLIDTFEAPSNPKEIKSLAYTYEDIENADGTRKFPELTAPWMKKSASASNGISNVIETLDAVAEDLTERPDSDKDNIERLVAIKRTLSYWSLDELRSLWSAIKNREAIIIDLFVDAVVQCGSNPTVMLLKELIESEQLDGSRAVLAVGALGFYVKTPSREILKEFLGLIKSQAVRSSKLLKQTALMSLAELLNYACESPYYKENRFSMKYLGDLCKSKEPNVIDDFLSLLVEELDSGNSSTADKMATLIALGSLGSEETLPILEPFLIGKDPDHNDPSVRIRAILSLYRLMFRHPERVMPLLVPLCENVAERPEVRMAAIGMLLTSNAPLVVWQRLASRMWIEPNAQVHAFLHDMLVSITKYPPIYTEAVTKARMALSLIKPTPAGWPYSSSYLRSVFLNEGIVTTFNVPTLRQSGEKIPVAFGIRSFYLFGPFVSKPFEIYAWNYNTEDFWHNLFERFLGKGSETLDELESIWDEIKPTRRPEDKTTGFIHLRLQDSIRYAFDYLQIEKQLPNLIKKLAEIQAKPYPISFLKYHTLAEVNLRIPTEIGLPLHFSASNPLLVSMQGTIASDLKGGSVRFDVASEFSWKLSTEVRVEMPWSGNYIASGIEVRAEIRPPRESIFKFSPLSRTFAWTVIPGGKIHDLSYYHVKPYTINRNVGDKIPTLEDESVNIIHVKESAFERNVPLAEGDGVDVRLLSTSELDHFDLASWVQWWQKWDPSYGFVPLKLRYRQHQIRYAPEKTNAKFVQFYLSYSHHWKMPQNGTIVTSSRVPVKSIRSINSIAEGIFKKIDGGTAVTFVGAIKSQMANGSFRLLQATLGAGHDDLYTRHYSDMLVERSFTDESNAQQVEYVLCGYSNRTWNKPPDFGLSADILSMHADSRYWFSSTSCADPEISVQLKTRAYRSETARTIAAESPNGRVCQEEQSQGQYDSPACHEAREMDHLYDVYEMITDFENIPAGIAQYFKQDGYLFNSLIRPFLVTRIANDNKQNRITWTMQRHPLSGNSDVTIVGLGETIEARDIRLAFPIFPALTHIWKVVYPVTALRSFPETARKHLTTGISEAKCYIGPQKLYTFDGVGYSYTMDNCDHVLLIDTWKKSNFAVLVRETEGRKIITVLQEKNRMEIDPSGFVSFNGVRRFLNGPFYLQDENRLIGEVNSFPDGVRLKLNDMKISIRIVKNQVTVDAPQELRGRTGGLCGDFDQETAGEFKTAGRCALRSGALMAASFKLTKKGRCDHSPEVSNLLQLATNSCISVDELKSTYLTPFDPRTSVSCTRYEPLVFKIGETTCTSTTLSIHCNAGCKPLHTSSKYFTFHCKGNEVNDFETQFIVPKACVPY